VRGRVIPALLAIAAIAAAPAAADPSASLPDIEDEVMCPVCGTTLELSDSPQAERERELIRRLIARGESKDEIKDTLVAQYGDDVLAEPEGSGFDLAAWVVPLLGLGLAAGAVVAFLVSRRRRPADSSSTAAPPPADTARLNDDMSRYDL
jgi:cytochrome c-type biogenesis protein CcmH